MGNASGDGGSGRVEAVATAPAPGAVGRASLEARVRRLAHILLRRGPARIVILVTALVALGALAYLATSNLAAAVVVLGYTLCALAVGVVLVARLRRALREVRASNDLNAAALAETTIALYALREAVERCQVGGLGQPVEPGQVVGSSQPGGSGRAVGPGQTVEPGQTVGSSQPVEPGPVVGSSQPGWLGNADGSPGVS